MQLSLQQLVGAAERLQQRGVMADRDIDWMGLVDEARDRMLRTPFHADAVPAYRKKQGEKTRLISVVEPCERLIEEALLPALHQRISSKLGPEIHGYVTGRSTYTAAKALRAHLAEGGEYVLQLDIQQFFDSIHWATLLRLMEANLPDELVAVLAPMCMASTRMRGRIVRRQQGLLLGRAISPVLANLYLAPLDRALRSTEVAFLRYGDDLLLCAHTRQQLDAAHAVACQMLQRLKLSSNADKELYHHYTGQPIEYLGHAVDAQGVYQRLDDNRLQRIGTPKTMATAEQAHTTAPVQPNRRNRALYITQPGLYLHIKDGQICCRQGDAVIRQIPLRSIDRILLLQHAAMSSGFISALVSRKIPLQIFVGRGKAYGSLVAGGILNPLRLRAQYDLSSQPGRRARLARSIVRAKLEAMLRRLRPVSGAATQRERITRLHTKLSRPDVSIDVIRGLEGMASRQYFAGFAQRIRVKGFAFKGRSRKPPKDAINSLMSFSYSLLFAEMMSALMGVGVDPHPGLLHDLRPDHPALASDLIEPYRILIADSFVLTLVNNKQVKPEGFYAHSHGGIFMTQDTRHTVLEAYEAFMTRQLGGGRGELTPRQMLDAAAAAYLAVVLGESEELTLYLGGGQSPHATKEAQE